MPPLIINTKLWLWDVMNTIFSIALMNIGSYERLIYYQNHYIKKLEYHNTHAQVYIAKAYVRAAHGHFAKGEFIQTIDKCSMAVYTYRYHSPRAYKLCSKAYRILNDNSQLFEGMHFWMKELFEDQKIT